MYYVFIKKKILKLYLYYDNHILPTNQVNIYDIGYCVLCIHRCAHLYKQFAHIKRMSAHYIIFYLYDTRATQQICVQQNCRINLVGLGLVVDWINFITIKLKVKYIICGLCLDVRVFTFFSICMGTSYEYVKYYNLKMIIISCFII